jgi:hypothetical protein
MLPWEDSVDQIDNTDSIYICYHEKTQLIRYTITSPIYIYYHEKTQFIRYTMPTLSTYFTMRRLSHSDIQYRPYVTMRRLSQSDIQYRPYRDMLPWEDSVNQIYNTDHICIYYHEKTQSIRYTIPTLSTYVIKRRLSQSDIQYRPYLHMLPWEDSVNQIYNTDPIYICYQEKTQSIRYTIPTLSTYITHEKTQSIRYTIPTLSTYITHE